MLSVLRGAALLLSGGWPVLIKLPAGHSFLEVTAGRAWGTVPMQAFWMVGLMLIHHLGPWGIIAGGAILFFGVFNWVFEPAG